MVSFQKAQSRSQKLEYHIPVAVDMTFDLCRFWHKCEVAGRPIQVCDAPHAGHPRYRSK